MRDTLASTPNHGYEFYHLPPTVRRVIELAHQAHDAWEIAEDIERIATRRNAPERMEVKHSVVALYRVWQDIEEWGAAALDAWKRQQPHDEHDPAVIDEMIRLVEESQP